jgi:hypothetical protein
METDLSLRDRDQSDGKKEGCVRMLVGRFDDLDFRIINSISKKHIPRVTYISHISKLV